MTVAVVTSIYGGVDPLREHPEQTVPCEWVAVVDQPMQTSGPWRQVVEPRPHVIPRMAAKYAKAFPHVYTDADVTIWIDGGAVITSSHFVAMCLDALGDGHRAQWVHPERDCIYDEADVTITMRRKYGDAPVREQAAWYRLTDHPTHWGLWATGCIVRRGVDPADQPWMNEMLRWTVQDQLSLPYVLHRHDLDRPRPLPEALWRNSWVRWMGHET